MAKINDPATVAAAAEAPSAWRCWLEKDNRSAEFPCTVVRYAILRTNTGRSRSCTWCIGGVIVMPARRGQSEPGWQPAYCMYAIHNIHMYVCMYACTSVFMFIHSDASHIMGSNSFY